MLFLPSSVAAPAGVSLVKLLNVALGVLVSWRTLVVSSKASSRRFKCSCVSATLPQTFDWPASTRDWITFRNFPLICSSDAFDIKLEMFVNFFSNSAESTGGEPETGTAAPCITNDMMDCFDNWVL